MPVLWIKNKYNTTSVSREDVASIIDILAENYSHLPNKRDPKWDWEYFAYQKAQGMWTVNMDPTYIFYLAH